MGDMARRASTSGLLLNDHLFLQRADRPRRARGCFAVAQKLLIVHNAIIWDQKHGDTLDIQHSRSPDAR
jgi:hypothetical protein